MNGFKKELKILKKIKQLELDQNGGFPEISKFKVVLSKYIFIHQNSKYFYLRGSQKSFQPRFLRASAR